MSDVVRLSSHLPGKAYPVEMGALFRECEKHGAVNIFSHDNGRYTANITRKLGRSELKTSHKSFDTPERAILHALQEAEAWGLPEIEL